ncbi:hypothetical protein RRF57_006888 [Xylaria bambusicola]|uniref:Uncharacterized protein n=1 Tax=Xylaria bambusicola TaxID=326684 RepID=A0AAN7UR27_9PEZI
MPPKKAPSKLPSVNDLARETKADGCSLGNSTLKPIMDSYGIRNRSITPANASLSPDELDTHAKAQDTEQPTSDKEVVLDEIIVTGLPLKQKTSADVWRNSHAVESTMAEPTRLLRRSQRASSTSQKITTTSPVPPLDKGVTAKKQEFEIGILRDDDCKSDELSLSSTLKRRRLDHESSPRIASRKSRSKWNNPDDMLTDPKSPLVNAKLRVSLIVQIYNG